MFGGCGALGGWAFIHGRQSPVKSSALTSECQTALFFPVSAPFAITSIYFLFRVPLLGFVVFGLAITNLAEKTPDVLLHSEISSVGFLYMFTFQNYLIDFSFLVCFGFGISSYLIKGYIQVSFLFYPFQFDYQ